MTVRLTRYKQKLICWLGMDREMAEVLVMLLLIPAKKVEDECVILCNDLSRS